MQDNLKYCLRKKDAVQWLTFPKLNQYPELEHGFTTRHGGVSTGEKTSWNFGKGPDETWVNIFKNYQILAEVLGTEPEKMVRTDQTHTATVLVVGPEHLGMGITRERAYTDVDGLVTACRDITLVTSHADCNALFFYDPKQKVIGLAHSGWRGTLKEISREMVKKMVGELGAREEDILVGIGPALCQDCFEVDEDVAELFYTKNENWKMHSYQRQVEGVNKHYLNLKAILRDTLESEGVPSENIFDMELCSRCHPELFYSYRRQKGLNGNMVSAMRMKPWTEPWTED